MRNLCKGSLQHFCCSGSILRGFVRCNLEQAGNSAPALSPPSLTGRRIRRQGLPCRPSHLLSPFLAVVSGRGRDMSARGRPPGLSSLCSQSSVGSMGCGMGGPVGGLMVGSTCSSSSASRAGSAGSLVGVGVPSLEGEVGCPDCAALYPITDDALLHNLHARYKRDQIYVSIDAVGVYKNMYI